LKVQATQTNLICEVEKLVVRFLKEAKQAEIIYYKELFDNKTNTNKEIWRNTKSVTAFQKSWKTAESIKSLKVNNYEFAGLHPSEVCNAFNLYFCSIGQKLVSRQNFFLAIPGCQLQYVTACSRAFTGINEPKPVVPSGRALTIAYCC
jgi:hypothetical protein